MAVSPRPDPKNRAAQAWGNWLSGLTSSARSAMTTPAADLAPPPEPPSAEAFDYNYWLGQLTDAARDDMARPQTRDAVDAAGARFALIELGGDGWPVIKIAGSPEALARRLADLEGEDICAVPVLGFVLGLTKGPMRYLLLPDGSAVTVPWKHPAGMQPTRVEAGLVPDDVEMQDDFFLGPQELSEAASDRPVRRVRYIAPGQAQDDDVVDDDEDASPV